MGYNREGAEGHEGHTVGFVEREGCSSYSGLYRELAYPADNRDRAVVLIAAGCECGWRSSSWRPDSGTMWGPFSVLESERDEDRVREAWRQHTDRVIAGCRYG